MEQIWKEMFQAAKAVQNGRQISDYVGKATGIRRTKSHIYSHTEKGNIKIYSSKRCVGV